MSGTGNNSNTNITVGPRPQNGQGSNPGPQTPPNSPPPNNSRADWLRAFGMAAGRLCGAVALGALVLGYRAIRHPNTRAGAKKLIKGTGATIRYSARQSVRLAQSDFGIYAIPMAIGALTAYEAWKGGYLPSQPPIATAAGALFVFAGVTTAVKWGFGTVIRPSVGKVLQGAFVAAVVYGATPGVVNQLVDNGLMSPDNPTVNVAHNIERTIPFSARYARDLGPPPGAVVSNAFIFAYDNIAGVAGGQPPALTLVPGSKACAIYVPGTPGVVDIKINGKDYFTSPQEWTFDSMRSPSDPCSPSPAAKNSAALSAPTLPSGPTGVSVAKGPAINL